MDKKNIMPKLALFILLLIVTLTSGCVQNLSNRSPAITSHEAPKVNASTIAPEANKVQPSQGQEINISSVIEGSASNEVWCNATPINYMTDPVISTWGFKVVYTPVSIDREFNTLISGQPVTVNLGISVPPKHKVDNVKIQFRLGSSNNYEYSEVFDLGDIPFSDKYVQDNAVLWTGNLSSSGKINLEAKITYTIDGESRVQCPATRELMVIDKKFPDVYFDISDPTPLKYSPLVIGEMEKATFNMTISSSDPVLNPGVPISGFIFRDDYPVNNFDFVEVKANCNGFSCKLSPSLGINSNRRSYFCKTNAPVFIVLQVPYAGVVRNLAKEIDLRDFVQKIGC